MKILIISADTRSLIHFRRDLMLDMIKNGHEVLAISPFKDERGDPSVLEKEGIKVFYIPFNRTGLNPFLDFYCFASIFNIIKKSEVDLVFSFMVKPVIYGSLAARMAGVRKIYSLIPGIGHIYLNERPLGGIFRFMISRLYQLAFFFNSKVFFQNGDDRALFISRKIVSSKKAYRINGSGVNMKIYERNQGFPEIPTFLLAGRMIAEKGISEFIKASRILKRKRGSSFKAILVGGFDKNPTSFNSTTLKEMNSDNAVEYLGDQEKMREVYERASIYVLPSYREGLPRSTLEAMSMKMPIITTDVPGCRETVVEGQNGFKVRPKSEESLAFAMEKFLIKPTDIPFMGQKSYELVREKFEVKRINKIYLVEMELLK